MQTEWDSALERCEGRAFRSHLRVRGRYVGLSISTGARGFAAGDLYDSAQFSVEGGELIARPAQESGGVKVALVNEATQARNRSCFSSQSTFRIHRGGPKERNDGSN